MHSPQSCPECGNEWDVDITEGGESFEFGGASVEPDGYVKAEKGVFVCEACGHVADKMPQVMK